MWKKLGSGWEDKYTDKNKLPVKIPALLELLVKKCKFYELFYSWQQEGYWKPFVYVSA